MPNRTPRLRLDAKHVGAKVRCSYASPQSTRVSDGANSGNRPGPTVGVLPYRFLHCSFGGGGHLTTGTQCSSGTVVAEMSRATARLVGWVTG